MEKSRLENRILDLEDNVLRCASCCSFCSCVLLLSVSVAKLNLVRVIVKTMLMWGIPREQQGVPRGCIVFTFLLAYHTATLLALFKAFPSVTPQFWQVLDCTDCISVTWRLLGIPHSALKITSTLNQAFKWYQLTSS